MTGATTRWPPLNTGGREATARTHRIQGQVGLIAKKLKRSPGAIYARINSLKKMPRELAFDEQPRSVPSERLAHARTSASQGQEGT
jgi:hypothetical protein